MGLGEIRETLDDLQGEYDEFICVSCGEQCPVTALHSITCPEGIELHGSLILAPRCPDCYREILDHVD